MPSSYLAFDLGAESGRALVGTLNNDRLTLDEMHRFSSTRGKMRNRLHWNLLQQWEDLKIGLKRAASADGSNLTLRGIGIDTWGVDFGLLDVNGEILASPVMYRDNYTDGVIERTFARISKEEIYDITGLQFMPFNTLFQLIALQERNSQILKIADSLLFMPDLFNYLFTGARKNEFSIATTSQMYNPRTKTWATDLLERLHLPTHILNPIVPSGTIIGSLSADVAEECGVPSDIPVIAPGCHDTASAVASVPATGSNWCYISSGTWSLMGVELDEPIINEKTLRYNYTNEGGVGGKIRFLKNIMGMWLVQECRRQFAAEGHDHNYTELTQMAERAKPFGALVDPDRPQFMSPGDMPEKIEAFCKSTRQTPPTSRGEFVRCCLESLALTYRRTIDILEEILGYRIEIIHIVGGGSKNELLNQMTADACARPVIAGPVEGTAIGNILTQAIATGEVKDLPHARQIIRNSFEVKRFDPQSPQKWTDAYTRFQSLLNK